MLGWIVSSGFVTYNTVKKMPLFAGEPLAFNCPESSVTACLVCLFLARLFTKIRDIIEGNWLLRMEKKTPSASWFEMSQNVKHTHNLGGGRRVPTEYRNCSVFA